MIRAVKGDITNIRFRTQDSAIVNAANETLLGGGGVDGAIHRAAGPELFAKCRLLHGCRPGEAKITEGFRLPSTYVIHTVGPRYGGGDSGEEETLKNCYMHSMELAQTYGIKEIAFPSISTGIFGYPVKAAACCAVKAVADFLENSAISMDVRWVLFDQMTYSAYKEAISKYGKGEMPDGV